jgi:hypothetical protein
MGANAYVYRAIWVNLEPGATSSVQSGPSSGFFRPDTLSSVRAVRVTHEHQDVSIYYIRMACYLRRHVS